ncbi:MAG: nucleotidyltransferase domain-containing protein [Nanoarchaeales archaeon]|nr:nucleotidyltransferase domain-containing protein [Nanoarchaeales archaeon]
MENLLTKYSKIIEELKTKKQIDSIILFGSYSTNSQKPNSDLDISIIFKPNSTQTQIDNILSYATEEFDLSDFENLPIPLQYKIVTSGTILKNKELINNIKFKIKHQYIDFLPYLKRSAKNRGIPLNIAL